MVTKIDEVESNGTVTRDELLAMGCEEVTLRQGRKVYVRAEKVIALECTKCSNTLYHSHFDKAKTRYAGVRSNCKECVGNYLSVIERKHNREKERARYQANKDYYREKGRRYRRDNPEYSRIYYETNTEKCRIGMRKYCAANPEIYKVNTNRRRARVLSLPDDLTTEQLSEINASFSNTCALSGEPTDLHADHVLPISIGHGGTTYGNMAPLSATLNMSKHANHIFEWFNANRERFNLEQSRFDALIEYLAQANEMTPTEYRAYVDWCFDNPMVICETTGELVFKDGAINERGTIT